MAAAPLAAQDPHPGVQVAGHRFREGVDPGRDDAVVAPVAAFGIQVGDRSAEDGSVGDCGAGRPLLIGLRPMGGLVWM